MDQELRDAERRFRAAPSAQEALAVLALAERARAPAREVLAWTLDVARWDALPEELHRAVALAVLRVGPEGLRFAALETRSLGAQTHRLAFFEQGKGPKLALVPGGEVTLGYDPAHPFVPTPAQAESFAWSAESFGLPSIDFCLEYPSGPWPHLTRVRTVRLQPLLVEVQARPLPFRTRPDGPDLAAFREDLRSQGFRLLTSDEWEHCCAAGTRTLFRWGDDCPTDEEPAHARSFDLHRLPNAFGLTFWHDPYEWEMCEEPTVVRGGDGGSSSCGGLGTLMIWINAFSSAFAQGLEPKDGADGRSHKISRARRVWPVLHDLAVT